MSIVTHSKVVDCNLSRLLLSDPTPTPSDWLFYCSFWLLPLLPLPSVDWSLGLFTLAVLLDYSLLLFHFTAPSDCFLWLFYLTTPSHSSNHSFWQLKLLTLLFLLTTLSDSCLDSYHWLLIATVPYDSSLTCLAMIRGEAPPGLLMVQVSRGRGRAPATSQVKR